MSFNYDKLELVVDDTLVPRIDTGSCRLIFSDCYRWYKVGWQSITEHYFYTKLLALKHKHLFPTLLEYQEAGHRDACIIVTENVNINRGITDRKARQLWETTVEPALRHYGIKDVHENDYCLSNGNWGVTYDGEPVILDVGFLEGDLSYDYAV